MLACLCGVAHLRHGGKWFLHDLMLGDLPLACLDSLHLSLTAEAAYFTSMSRLPKVAYYLSRITPGTLWIVDMLRPMSRAWKRLE